MNPLHVAIVGCGWVGGSHAEEGFGLLPERFEVRACCDADPARAAAFAARYEIPHALSDYAALLARDDIDVVSICTPPSLHFEMVRDALAAGRHVICEKPFTSSLALIDEVIALEAKASGRVMPVLQYRFAPGIQRVRHLLQSGLAGRAYVSSVETAWLRTADYYAVPWRGKRATELGGVLVTQASHIHDLFTWLMGPVSGVRAFKTTRVNPIEVEDCAVASLEMADGSLASLTATLGSLSPLTRLRLCFENLVVERQPTGPEAIRPGFEPWTVAARTEALQAEADRIMAEAPVTREGFAGQFEDFADALAEGRPFAVGLGDARQSLELITAIYGASETGETVTLPLGADHPRYRGWSHD